MPCLRSVGCKDNELGPGKLEPVLRLLSEVPTLCDLDVPLDAAQSVDGIALDDLLPALCSAWPESHPSHSHPTSCYLTPSGHLLRHYGWQPQGEDTVAFLMEFI
jgi:hypothetical protein